MVWDIDAIHSIYKAEVGVLLLCTCIIIGYGRAGWYGNMGAIHSIYNAEVGVLLLCTCIIIGYGRAGWYGIWMPYIPFTMLK